VQRENVPVLISLSFESGAKVKLLRFSQRSKQNSPTNSTDDGRQNDFSDRQHWNAVSIRTSLEFGANESVSRHSQPQKLMQPSDSTDAGTQSDCSDLQLRNVSSSIRFSVQSDGKVTTCGSRHPEKQSLPVTAAETMGVASPGIANRESRQNETVRSAAHPRKHARRTEVTDDGREMDESFEQPSKAKSSIDEM
jgi:hypothetical protein